MKKRCSWASGNELNIRYHDKEWGVPTHDDTVLFESLCLEGQQAGLSWIIILKKRENYRNAFYNFDVKKISKMKHSIATIICCLLMSNTVIADSVEMADLMRSNGKIYVVVAVIAIIFIGLMAYLYRIDQRVKKLEK